MSGQFRNRILEHQEMPSSANWDKISQRLDKEYVLFDTQLSIRLNEVSIAPPSSSWSVISASLQEEPFSQPEATPRFLSTRAKVVPLLYKRLAVAAALVGVVTLGAITLFSGRRDPASQIVPQSQIISGTTPSATPNKIVPRSEQLPPGQPFAPVQPDKQILASVDPVRRVVGRTPLRPALPDEPEQETRDIEQARFNTMQTVAALQPVAVAAPPIRDNRGKIIMDLNLIRKPNDPYITVTGPNGNQTKISSKFAHCLSYLNGDLSSIETNPEGKRWKSRFQEWRNKLLGEAAFVPSANNFFDIFELQQMIQD